MTWILILFFVSLLLSAFFSGVETGFYRASRVRLVLDGLSGDLISRGLLRLTNHPTLFVATSLVGNNIANYLTSLAIVLATGLLLHGESHLAELLIPVALSPVIFVYGELLPKNLFYRAPNRMLRWSGPLFFIFAILFAPVSALLWLFGRFLQAISGSTPLQVQLTLARKELQQVLQEGQEAGILQPAQRRLAQNLFSAASLPVQHFLIPRALVVPIRLGDKKKDVIRLANRHKISVIAVVEKKGPQLVGYVRIIDLYLDQSETIQTVLPLLEIREGDSHIAALLRMQSEKSEIARVVDENQKTIGLLYADSLTEPLFRGE